MPPITFSGLASGIDADAIIKTMIESRRLANAPFEQKKEFNDRETKALEELNTKLLSLKDAVNDFRTLQGSGISKNVSVSNSEAVSAAATSAASAGSVTIDTQQIAKSAFFSFNDRFASSTTPIAPSLAAPATIQITVGQGAEAKVFDIEVTNESTLSSIADEMNAEMIGKGRASVVNLGTEAAPQFALIINTVETGVDKGLLTVSVPPELSGQGVFAASTMQQAQDAIFTISGIGQVTKPTNKISNLIPGVTFELKQDSVGPVELTISDDREKTADKFGKVVEAINAIINYVKENDKIERVEEKGKVANKYFDLAKTRIDDEAISSVRDSISDAVSQIANSSIRVLADLGLTSERDGTYKFDREKFVEGLGKDSTASTQLLNSFADAVGNTGGIIDNYTRYQGQIDMAISANSEENDSITERLDRAEISIEKETERLRKIFTNLETKVSQLNSAGNALSSMISSLAVNR